MLKYLKDIRGKKKNTVSVKEESQEKDGFKVCMDGLWEAKVISVRKYKQKRDAKTTISEKLSLVKAWVHICA